MASATESQPLGAPAAQSREPLFVFVHIPKAAGTSFGRVLRCHFGGGFDRLDQVRRGRLQEAAARGSADGVLAVGPEVRAVSGHIPFGFSRFFPEDARYVTVLRDPVERTLSQYEYLLHRVGRPWGHDRLPPPTAELTLTEALGRGYVRDNVQTRMLCGNLSMHDELPPDALEQAKRNLSERFACVGTTERFDEFLALLNLTLGWPTVAYKEGRVTPGRRRAEDLPAEERRIVEAANTLDRELHAHAETLLERALAATGPEVEIEAEVLRRALPLERRAYRGEAVGDPVQVRSFPLEARVALALKEAELGRARELARTKLDKLGRLKAIAVRRADRIRELKRLLEQQSG